MSSLSDYFTFDIFITRGIITIIYAAGVTFLIGAAIWIFIWGRVPPMSYKSADEAFWAGFAILVFGNLIWRLVCEFVVVVFKINDSLISIDEKMKDDTAEEG